MLLVLREVQSEEDGNLYANANAELDGMCKISFSGIVVAPSAFGKFHAKSGQYEFHVNVM
jgi:hypothetical protein